MIVRLLAFISKGIDKWLLMVIFTNSKSKKNVRIRIVILNHNHYTPVVV